MRVVSSFPHSVENIETEWIQMPDGCHLAARVWVPDNAYEKPAPTVLDYNPYRRRDETRQGDDRMMGYFSGYGYACLRVDIRGSGDSEGLLKDEYLKQEQDDALAIFDWMAKQPWSNGEAAIIGISWGGFNGLQIAARRPPQLKTVISLCSTDDRYADDIHYMGGCLLGDNLSWGSVMFGFNSLPPDPEVVGEKWREMWAQRLEGNGPWLEKWLRHQTRDEVWKHGSICEDYSSINIPVFLASGWADGYSNAIFRMLENLGVPRKALVGPWSHTYPQYGTPGPAIGFLQEVLRWLDYWMKGIEGETQKDPQIRVWMQDSVPPHPTYRHRPGRWVSEDEWPSENIEFKRFQIFRDFLLLPEDQEPVNGKEEALNIESPLSVGLFAGKWCSYAAPPDLPHDQREEDGGALVFETKPLDQSIEIMGPTTVDLELSSNRPVAMIAVRLSDVAVNGEATRVTYGLLNLTHRDSHENPGPLVPGEKYRVSIQLNDVAQRFAPGHRIRLSLSTTYFPLAWPPPRKAMLTIYTGQSELFLPVRKPRESDKELRRFGDPETAPGAKVGTIEPEDRRWTVIRDLGNDVSTLEVVINEGLTRFEEHGLVMGNDTREYYSCYRGDDHSYRGEVINKWRLSRQEWSVNTTTRTVLTSDEKNFYLHASMDAYEADQRFMSKDWSYTIPRDNV